MSRIPPAAQGISSSQIAPTWLVEDMLRVEEILLGAAGGSSNPLVAAASTHLVKAGGKRLRPSLVLLASRVGEPGRRETDLAAAAVELVHLASLYHDDVLDQTGTRRGVPTAHSEWGVDVAILAGDYLFAKGCWLGARAGDGVPLILSNAIAELCEGQIAESNAVGDPQRSVDEYLDTITRKTASLFRSACEMGASTAGAPLEDQAALADYGLNLGLAFQVVDDLLDFLGDPQITGKVPGTDLREGVYTLPVLIACERDASLQARLARGDRDLDRVLPVLESTGALDAALDEAASFGRRAASSLDGLPDDDWKAVLLTIVEGVLAQLN